jgi:hypothetical protein
MGDFRAITEWAHHGLLEPRLALNSGLLITSINKRIAHRCIGGKE